MITERDLADAISECHGVRNPNANTCIKLASYYTIQDHMYGEPDRVRYSYSNSPTEIPGDSEFLQAVKNKDMVSVMTLMDELMGTLNILSPRLYRGVMNKLKG